MAGADMKFNKNGKFKIMQITDIQEIYNVSPDTLKLLENAVLLVKHIGCDRTRGLGLIHTSLEQTPEKINSEEKKFEFYEQNKISYSIRLISPMLCKSTTGNQAKATVKVPGQVKLAKKITKKMFKKV